MSMPLEKIIYKNYLTSSLIPIFTIEIVLLILYFAISYFITHKSQEMLYEDGSKNLLEITKREANQINYQLQEISRTSQMMQKEHERFFASKDLCVLPNGKPVFSTHKNGAYYKSKDNGGASVYYSSSTKLGEAEKWKSRCSEVIDPFIKNIVETNPIITQAYLNTYDNFNRIYPYIEDIPSQYGSAIEMKNYNFYYLADIAHNPHKKSVWTGAYLDPAGQGWMISNIVPIYNNSILEGVSGLDITIEQFVTNVLNLDLPTYASAFLVDEKGMILAMPESMEGLFQLKELKDHLYKEKIKSTVEKPEDYNLLKTPNKTIRAQLESFFVQKTNLESIRIGGEEYIITQEIIPETGWKMMVMLQKSKLFESINALKAKIDFIGYIVIVLMLLFYALFFLYLLRKSKKIASQISTPIEELSFLTKDLGKSNAKEIDTKSGIQEVDQLTYNFNTLSQELESRTQDYIQSQLREKMIEKDAEIAYRAGLFESASSYLHNIGNALTMLDAKVRLMKNVSAALRKTSLGFDKLLELIHSSSASPSEKERTSIYIQEFNKALSSDIFNEIEDITQGIEYIKNHSVDSIRHQQDLFNDSNSAAKNYLQRFNVISMLETLVEDYRIVCITQGIKMTINSSEVFEIDTMKFQFHSGISNVLKNAIESIDESKNKGKGTIEINAKKNKSSFVLEISDNGIGMSQLGLSKLFTSGYTTKKAGHGLGLHAFNNFLNTHNGHIEAKSKGINTGATIIISIEMSSNE